MNPLTLAQEIIDGRRITREDDLSFFLTCDLDELCEGADRIREACIGDKVDLCSIINGRSGRCPEDCKYCAQSAHHHTSCEVYNFLPEEAVLGMYQAINPGVHSVLDALIIFNMPFTFIKGLCSAIIAILLYRPMLPILKISR